MLESVLYFSFCFSENPSPCYRLEWLRNARNEMRHRGHMRHKNKEDNEPPVDGATSAMTSKV